MCLQRSVWGGVYLHDGSFSGNFENLTFANGAITEADIDDFCELGELDVIEDDEGTINLDNGAVVDAWSDVVIAGDCCQVGIEQLALIHQYI